MEYAFQICGSVSRRFCPANAGQCYFQYIGTGIISSFTYQKDFVTIIYLYVCILFVCSTGACSLKDKISTGTANHNLLLSTENGPYLNYTDGAECGLNQHWQTLVALFCGPEQSHSRPTTIKIESCRIIIQMSTPFACEKNVRNFHKYFELA